MKLSEYLTPMKITEYPKPFFMIYDTETSGLPKNYNAPLSDSDNWPRLSQLSYQIYDGNRNLIKSFNKFIHPNGEWTFPDEEFFRKNADINKNINEGIALIDVINEFIHDRLLCDFAICHNVSFDSKIVRAEMFRLGITQEFDSVKVCTMSNAHVVAHCGLQKKNSNAYGKWPTLSELHNKLFNCEFEGAHDSNADVTATAKCFFKLLELNIINLESETTKHNEKISKFKA